MLKIKKMLGISLAVLFLLSITATAVSADTIYETIKPNVIIDQTSGYAPLTVTFTDDSSSNGGVPVYKWWSWGDGMVGSSSTANVMKHTYKYPGTFKFGLKLRNYAGPVWYYETINVY